MTGDEIESAGGAAFPGAIPENFREAWPGMTLRDYFAAHFMAMACTRVGEIKDADLERLFPGNAPVDREDIIALLAYRMADAMLKRRGRS